MSKGIQVFDGDGATPQYRKHVIQLNCVEFEHKSLPLVEMITMKGPTGATRRIIAVLNSNQRALEDVEELIINDEVVAENINIGAIYDYGHSVILEY